VKTAPAPYGKEECLLFHGGSLGYSVSGITYWGEWMVKRICALASVVLLLLAAGCITDGKDKSGSSLPEYKGFGSWPEYTGAWASLRNAAGSKNSTWAYLEVSLKDDGTFAGTYRKYQYDYTYYLDTAFGSYPVQVYNPSGKSQEIRGAIDFGAGAGIATLGGMGETTCTVQVLSSKEIALIFPTGFGFTVANIQR
jgi:hypothetical protein